MTALRDREILKIRLFFELLDFRKKKFGELQNLYLYQMEVKKKIENTEIGNLHNFVF